LVLRLINRLSMDLATPSAYTKAFVFFLYVLICAHLLACLFFMIPTFFECDLPTDLAQLPPWFDPDDPGAETCLPSSWRTVYGLEDRIAACMVPTNAACAVHKLDPYSKYISALYWSLTTMTTIGYGDRGPQNEPEVVVSKMGAPAN
jgi:hypothetical protein